MKILTILAPRQIVGMVFLCFGIAVSLFAQDTSLTDRAFFSRELCPPGAEADECEVVKTFTLESSSYSIAIVENYFFRNATFGIAHQEAQSWELITAGPLMDLEVMAYSPADPFSYEHYPRVLLEIPPVALYELLSMVEVYFEEIYGY